MTKKKALKKIMALGMQRNEVQRVLSAAHKKGLNNREAVDEFRAFSIFFCMKEALEAETGASVDMTDMIRGLLARVMQVPNSVLFSGEIVYENSCD